MLDWDPPVHVLVFRYASVNRASFGLRFSSVDLDTPSLVHYNARPALVIP